MKRLAHQAAGLLALLAAAAAVAAHDDYEQQRSPHRPPQRHSSSPPHDGAGYDRAQPSPARPHRPHDYGGGGGSGSGGGAGGDQQCAPAASQSASYTFLISNTVANTNVDDRRDTFMIDSGAIPLPPGRATDAKAVASCQPDAGAQGALVAAQAMQQLGGSCRLKCQNVQDYKKVGMRSSTWGTGSIGSETRCRYASGTDLSGPCEARAVAFCAAPEAAAAAAVSASGPGAASGSQAGGGGAAGRVRSMHPLKALDELDALDALPVSAAAASQLG